MWGPSIFAWLSAYGVSLKAANHMTLQYYFAVICLYIAVRHQSITWTIVDEILWRHMELLEQDELNPEHFFYLLRYQL